MWEQIRSQVSNSNLLQKIWDRWFTHEKETMEEAQFAQGGTPYASRIEGDWLSQDPRSWYYGPLEVFTQNSNDICWRIRRGRPYGSVIRKNGNKCYIQTC